MYESETARPNKSNAVEPEPEPGHSSQAGAAAPVTEPAEPLLLERAPLAYENPEFLSSPDGRIIRILAEYNEPLARFRHERIQDTIVFFGSARFHGNPDAGAASDAGRSPGRPLDVLSNTGALEPAPENEQPATIPEIQEGTASELGRRRAVAAVEMTRYYEDARRLAHMLTTWAKDLPPETTGGPARHRFVITSGGGPGIMEAANRGAWEAGGKSIGLNIRLPFEQRPNPYITPELNFEFHYFFMRKLWFAYLAKALVVFPGGFGTIDEMFEVLTLVQTHKLAKNITVVIYGSEYWKKVFNFDWLVDTGAISPGDLQLFHYADTPEQAFAMLQAGLVANHLKTGSQPQTAPAAAASPEEQPGPEFARTL